MQPQIIFTTLAIASLASAQQINLLGGGPSCAQSCSVLTDAQQLCASSTNVVSSVAACFCTQQTTTNLRTTPAACPSCSSAEDQQSLTQWFAALCAAPQTLTVAPAAAATQPAGNGNGGATATANPAQSTNDGTSGSNTNGAQSGDQRSWWDKHSRWVIMVIVLLIGFSIIIAVGIWWKKRYTRKKQQQGSMPSSSTSVWGPRQSHPSVDRLGNSNSDPDYLSRDYYGGLDEEKGQARATTTHSGPEMSSTVQRDRSRNGTARSRSRNGAQKSHSSTKGKRLHKLDKMVGRS